MISSLTCFLDLCAGNSREIAARCLAVCTRRNIVVDDYGGDSMTQDELKAWALKNGWQMIAGCPSLTKPSAPKEAIVRMVLKATVVHVRG